MLEALFQPIIFAHRGASAHAPENTIAAFELALKQQADAVELDVKLSADGQVIVIHGGSSVRLPVAQPRKVPPFLEEMSCCGVPPTGECANPCPGHNP